MLVMNFSIFIKVEWLVLAKTRISKGVLLMPVSSRSFQLTHWSCKKRRGADVFSEIIDESILVESLNLRDPSTCVIPQLATWPAVIRGIPIRYVPPCVSPPGGKFDPNAASGSSRASFQNFVNLRIVVVFALKDKRGIQPPLSKTSIFLLACSLIPVTGFWRLKNPSCCYNYDLESSNYNNAFE